MSRAAQPAESTFGPDPTPIWQIAWDIRRIAHELGHTPTRDEYETHGKHGRTTAERACGCWLEAICAAGLKPRPGQLKSSREERLAIRRAYDDLERAPTVVEAEARLPWSRSIDMTDREWDDLLTAADVPTQHGTVADAIRELWGDRHPWQDHLRFGAADIARATGLHVSRVGHLIRSVHDREVFDTLRLSIAETGGKSNARVWEVRE